MPNNHVTQSLDKRKQELYRAYIIQQQYYRSDESSVPSVMYPRRIYQTPYKSNLTSDKIHATKCSHSRRKRRHHNQGRKKSISDHRRNEPPANGDVARIPSQSKFQESWKVKKKRKTSHLNDSVKRTGSCASKKRNVTINKGTESIKRPKDKISKNNTENCSRTNDSHRRSSKSSKNTKQIENTDNSALRSAKIYKIIDESE